MRRPRFRFTVRRLMIVVAVAAAVMAIEVRVYRYARDVVAERGDGSGYVRPDAIGAWALFHIPLMFFLATTRFSDYVSRHHS